MNNSVIVISKPLNKDTLHFNGFYKGQKIEKVLVTNKIFQEDKTYMVKLENIEISGSSLIGDVKQIKEIV